MIDYIYADLFNQDSIDKQLTLTFNGGTVSYQWYYRLSDDSSWAKWSGKTSATLSNTVIESQNGMQVYCTVTNESGRSINSNTVTITFSESTDGPTITSQPKDMTVTAGDKVTFTIGAEGNGLSYTWYYKKADSSTWGYWPQDTNALTVTSNSTWDAMQVFCLVADEDGNLTASNVITITLSTVTAISPAISTQPTSVTASIGDTVTFSVGAGGEAVTNEDIYSESMTIDESICSEEQLTFGACEASTFKIRIANSFISHIGQRLNVALTLAGNTSEPFNIGMYTVQSDRPTSDRIYRDITAYDKMYDIINADATVVAEWYSTILPNDDSTVTMKEFRTSFLSLFNIVQEDVTLANDDMVVAKTIDPESLTGKTVITAICEINGCFGHIGRDGKFQYIYLETLSSSAETLTSYISGDYEEYETSAITSLQIRQEEDDIGCTYGDGDNRYVIQDNFLVYGKGTDELSEIAANIYAKISGITYRPASATVRANLCREVGDGYVANTKYQDVYSYILKRTVSGIQAMQDTYEADGVETYAETGNSLADEIIQLKGKSNVLTRTIEETKSQITDMEEGLVNTLTQTASETKSEIASTQNTWDTSGYSEYVSSYGLPDESGYDASDYSGQYYLDQKTGIIYVSDGSSWVIVEQLNTLQYSINATIDEVIGSVSSISSELTKVSESVSDISVGGRNLVLNSTGNLGNVNHWDASRYTPTLYTDGYNSQNALGVERSGITSTSRYSFGQSLLTHLAGTSAGDEITVTYWYYVDSSITVDGDNTQIFLRLYNTDNSAYSQLATLTISSDSVVYDTWQRFSQTVQLPYDSGGNAYLYVAAHLNIFLKVSCIKIEKGNTATDWTPAPEDLEANAESYTNERLTSYTVTEEISNLIVQEISDSESSIRSELSKTYAETTEVTEIVQSAVSSISAGATNLLAGTKDFSGATVSGEILEETYLSMPVLYYDNTDGSTYVTLCLWKDAVNAEASTQYTLSFYAKGSGTMNSYFYVGAESVYSNQGITTMGTNGLISHELTEDWARYVITWTTSDSASGTMSVIPARILAGGTCYISAVKFEKGNTATDWSPAPVDALNYTDTVLQSYYTKTEVSNEITQAINDYDTSTVSQLYYSKTTVDTLIDASVSEANDYTNTTLNDYYDIETVEEKLNTITQTITDVENSISLELSETYSTVGGRNYLLNTKDLTTDGGSTVYTAYTLSQDSNGFGVLTATASSAKYAIFMTGVDASDDAWAGKKAIISMDVKSDSLTSMTGFAFRIAICGSNDGTTWAQKYYTAYIGNADDFNTDDYADNEWVRVILKFTIPATSEMSTLTSTEYSQYAYAAIFHTRSQGNGASFSVRKPKLELSSIASDWTPAPEDSDDYTDSAISKYSETVTASLVLSINTDTDGNKYGSLSANADYISLTGSQIEIITNEFELSGGSATFSGTLAANTVTANSIAADAVTAEKINMTSLTGDEAFINAISTNTVVVGAVDAAKSAVKSATLYYATSSSATEAPGSSATWSETCPAKQTNAYIWQKIIYTYVSGATSESDPVCISGLDGEDGSDGTDGVGIKSVTEYYAVSSSNSTAPTSWSTSVQTMTTTNKYLWNYEVITYTDGTTSSTSKRVIGAYGNTGSSGSNGTDGVGISSITNYYLRSSSSSGVTTSTSGWTTTIQTITTTYKYLWNYEVVAYTDNTSYTSTPCIIGVYGDTGEAGEDGEDGQMLYATCTSAESAVVKVATLSSGTISSLKSGVTVAVTFEYANTANLPALNVGGTGSKAITVYGSPLTGTSVYNWVAGSTVQFVYDGTYWVMTETSALYAVGQWCYDNDTTYIDGGTIAAGTIAANSIVAGSITATQIASGAITADKINVTDLFAQDITATGTIRGVTLEAATGTFTGTVTTTSGSSTAKLTSGSLQLYYDDVTQAAFSTTQWTGTDYTGVRVGIGADASFISFSRRSSDSGAYQSTYYIDFDESIAGYVHNFYGTENHRGAATFSSTMSVTGTATFSSTMSVTGTATFSSQVYLANNAILRGTATSGNSLTLIGFNSSDEIVVGSPGSSSESAPPLYLRGETITAQADFTVKGDLYQSGDTYINSLQAYHIVSVENVTLSSSTTVEDGSTWTVSETCTAPGTYAGTIVLPQRANYGYPSTIPAIAVSGTTATVTCTYRNASGGSHTLIASVIVIFYI